MARNRPETKAVPPRVTTVSSPTAVALTNRPRVQLHGRRSMLGAMALLLAACASNSEHLAGGGSQADSPAGDQIALTAISMIGKPYRWGGDDPERGFDCSGLVQHVVDSAAGVRLPRTARRMAGAGRAVSSRSLQPGDLVFFNTGRHRNSHVGIYVGNGRFVHAPASGKRIRLSELSNPYWRRTYNGARRAIR